MNSLVSTFEEVGLTLQGASVPFGGERNRMVFGLDIQGDKFRAWVPDHVRTNVSAKDDKMHQVVLTVKEPKAKFELEIWKQELRPGDKVLREWKEGRAFRLLVERETPSDTRHFLCGVDERNHPFIAQLSRSATSIREAHELLKPPELRGKKVKGFGKNSKVKTKESVFRQGEWFFVKASPAELSMIESFLAKVPSQKKVPVQPTRGNPHTVDERVSLPVRTGAQGRTFPASVYVRGKVKHIEHETLEFQTWMRVLKNEEKGGSVVGSGAGSWID